MTQLDLFSSEFLASLRQQVRGRTKTSKALLQAIKDLSIININNKKRIAQVQAELTELKNQNCMLMEIIQSNKADYTSRLKLKEKAIQNGIQIQAKLQAQNEALKNEIERIRDQLVMLKNGTRPDMGRDYREKSVVSNASDIDLNAYLYSQRDMTERSMKSISQFQQQEDTKEKGKERDQRNTSKQKYISHKSHTNLGQIGTKSQIFQGKIYEPAADN